MARGKKTREEDKAKVVAAKIEDPQKSLRDLEKETWENRMTIKRTLDEVPEIVTSCDKGKEMINKLDNTLNMIQNIIDTNLQRLNENKERLEAKDMRQLSAIGKETFERRQILTWKPTNNINLNIDLSEKTSKQLEEMRNQLLW